MTRLRASRRFASAARCVAVAGLLAIGFYHSVHAYRSWQQWRTWRVDDPSAADFYWTDMEVEMTFAAACYLAPVLVWRIGGHRPS